jgi:hypothetical protein
MKSGDEFNHRGVRYKYHEWKTWDNKPASAFWCADQYLLAGLNVKSFSEKTEEEMHLRIDDYIDNRFYYRSMIESVDELKMKFYKNNSVDD